MQGPSFSQKFLKVSLLLQRGYLAAGASGSMEVCICPRARGHLSAQVACKCLDDGGITSALQRGDADVQEVD